MRQLLIVMCVIATVPTVTATDGLIERFLSRDDVRVTAFVALRRLEATNQRFNKTGWMDACVTQQPGAGFHFTVIGEGGSGYIRDKVLRKALEGERDLINSGETTRGALTSINYDMTPADAPAALGETVIVLRPKRKDGLLVDGRAVVTDPEGDLLRIEGHLVKTPSWWTRSVRVVRRYARVGGIRVPVETESTAEVRIAGRSHFRMRSTFLSVNGAAIEIAPELTRSGCLVTEELAGPREKPWGTKASPPPLTNR